MAPEIIDPLPFRRPMPFLLTVQDAVNLCIKEKDNFYVSALMFQCWISQLSLENAAQLAEKPDPADRFFQAGNAYRGFQKTIGKASDSEVGAFFGHLMQFAEYDDPWAEDLMEAMIPLSIEHQLTGQFIGPRTPDALQNQPRKLLALINATIVRLCDWLDAALQFQVFQEWHVMPDCFDPDPQKRELSYLAINNQNSNLMDDRARARWLTHMADVAQEMKNSPKWAVYRQILSTPPPQKRLWPNIQLDCTIIKLWPILKYYDWAPADLLFALRKILPAAALAPCPDDSALMTYAANTLSLRRADLKPRRPAGTEPPQLNLAVRLCETSPGGDAPKSQKPGSDSPV